MNTFEWHIQTVDDIWDVLYDWGYHKFICVVKNGSVVEFSGLCDETYDGEIIEHLDCIDGDYDSDDIMLWMEIEINK